MVVAAGVYPPPPLPYPPPPAPGGVLLRQVWGRRGSSGRLKEPYTYGAQNRISDDEFSAHHQCMQRTYHISEAQQYIGQIYDEHETKTLPLPQTSCPNQFITLPLPIKAKTSLTGRPKTNVQGLTSNAGSSDRRHRASQFFPSSQSEHGFGWGLSSPDPPVRKNSHSAYPRFRAAGCKGGMSASGVGGIGGAVLRNGLHFSAPNRAHCRGCST